MQHRRLTEHERFTAQRERIDSLEAALQKEATQRAASDNELQAHVDARLAQLAQRTSSDLAQLRSTVQSSMDHVLRVTSELSAALEHERAQRYADLVDVASGADARAAEAMSAVQAERSARQEHEQTSLQRCGCHMRTLAVLGNELAWMHA